MKPIKPKIFSIILSSILILSMLTVTGCSLFNNKNDKSSDAVDVEVKDVKVQSDIIDESSKKPIFEGYYPTFEVKTSGYDALQNKLNTLSDKYKQDIERSKANEESSYNNDKNFYFTSSNRTTNSNIIADIKYSYKDGFSMHIARESDMVGPNTGGSMHPKHTETYNYNPSTGEDITIDKVVKDKKKVADLIVGELRLQYPEIDNKVVNAKSLEELIESEINNNPKFAYDSEKFYYYIDEDDVTNADNGRTYKVELDIADVDGRNDIDIQITDVECNSQEMAPKETKPAFRGSYPTFAVKTEGYDKLQSLLDDLTKQFKAEVEMERQTAISEYNSGNASSYVNGASHWLTIYAGVEESTKSITRISVTKNYYQGGPHPYAESTVYNIESSTGLMVQYDDIVKDKDRAYELVKADVHKQHPGLSIYEDSLRKYIFQEDGYKQTFTFDKNYVYFHYDKGDIAMYAALPIEVAIPRAELDGASTSNSSNSSTNSSNSSTNISSGNNSSTGSTGNNTAPTVSMNQLKSITASSTLVENGQDHKVQNLINNDNSLAWVEGAPGNGIGENVVFTFNNPAQFRGFTIQNGYSKSGELFQKNARAKRLRFEFSDGSKEYIDVSDTINSQSYSFSKPIVADGVTMYIESVYPGNTYEDTCITSIRFN